MTAVIESVAILDGGSWSRRYPGRENRVRSPARIWSSRGTMCREETSLLPRSGSSIRRAEGVEFVAPSPRALVSLPAWHPIPGRQK